MVDEYDYFTNKRNDRVYLSRSLDNKRFVPEEGGGVKELVRPFRIVSKVIDCKESHEFFRDGKEVSLRITPGQRQEIKAKFYEDNRGVFTLTIQRYNAESGLPHSTYFTFVGREISVLYNFLRNIAILPLASNESAKLDDRFIEEITLSKEQFANLLESQPELAEELLRSEITASEVALLGERKNALVKFQSLLNDEEYFEKCLMELGANKKPEDVWQDFFEKNTWIFGFGLSYQFNTSLEGKKLEQVVSGFDFNSRGKRVDGLIKTRGLLSSLAFCEIKTHRTPLLQQLKSSYRPGAWQIASEIAGGIAQVQATVQASVENIRTKIDFVGKDGAPTGEEVYLYKPRSFLIAGSLGEFSTPNGVNQQKYSSFELFRRDLVNPEIITFDELYERARNIVHGLGADSA